MSKPFLEKIADRIREKYPDKGNRLCVVMPNRRAGLFLKSYLAPTGQKPIWAPAIFSVEDFVSRLSGLTIPDSLAMMFSLYESHCEVEQTEAQVFDEFIGWGRGLIRDFDETDQYLADPSTLFNFLSETKALSLWNLDERPLTEFEQHYLKFFNSLPDYYKSFTEKLLNQKLAYHGLACRVVAAEPENFIAEAPWDQYIFAGFNAITPAQLRLIKYLIGEGKAEIMWDADAYYLDDPNQEAGRFLRKYKNDRNLGEFGEVTDYFSKGEKTINIAGIPRNTGQARLAGNIIRDLIEKGTPEILGKTAVVLADESLLLPLLNAIPPEAGQFNITMGFPLPLAPLYRLFDNLMMMHVNATSGKNQTEACFYNKDILSVLQHSYTPLITEPEMLKKVIVQIRSSRNAFVSLSDLSGDLTDNKIDFQAFRIIFEKIESPASLTTLLIQLIDLFRIALTKNKTDNEWHMAETEILFNMAIIANRLHALATESGLIGNLSTLHTLFREVAQTMPVAFYGEPLKGIQVMGMLETRTLDFENVILISANEDTLPSKKSYNSFIPFDVRQHFGLPTHQDQQAVFAYHFYRLLQRSKESWLIYNSEAGDMGGGEKSRFISQIITELPHVNPNIKIQEFKSLQGTTLTVANPISINKNEETGRRLKEISTRGFSPTALNTYLNCSLRFYFTYMLRLDEPEEAEENIDYRTLGNIVHEVMHEFLLPFIDRVPDITSLKSLNSTVENAVGRAVQKHFKGGDITTGRNLLIMRVAEVWIRRLISSEIAESEIRTEKLTIIGLEEVLEKELILKDTPNGDITVKLKGTADRIDRIGNLIRIIDYKTGKIKSSELKLKQPADLFDQTKPAKEKAFQLLFYMMLADENNRIRQSFPGLQSGIISFRSLNQGFMPLVVEGIDADTAIQEFKEGLEDLLRGILDPGIPFSQTQKEENCAICPFRTICHKTEEKKFW